MTSQELPFKPQKPKHEVADVLRLYGPAYRRSHRLTLDQHRVMRDIERCRTPAMGGHLCRCDSCGHERYAFNSCRNRHCPKCQGNARRKWVEARCSQLLPVEYFHVVFTLPSEINPLWRYNRRLIPALLFQAMAETLLEFGQRHLNGEIGFTAVLHTWGQTMSEHLHLHSIVTGGALSTDGKQWRSCAKGYLFPVEALSLVFRGKYCEMLRRAFRRGELKGSEALVELSSPAEFAPFMAGLKRQNWVVYAKRPFAGPEQVINYVGRYTHRVAITNSRILDVGEGRVRFTYKDYRDEARIKQIELSAAEFIGRFMQHVLPAEFVRIRHYGVLANGRRSRLERCRELLSSGMAAEEQKLLAGGEVVQEWREEAPPHDQCEVCGRGVMRPMLKLPWVSNGPPGEWESLRDAA
jgi:Putative transposase/Transposase zinc-binding domain